MRAADFDLYAPHPLDPAPAPRGGGGLRQAIDQLDGVLDVLDVDLLDPVLDPVLDLGADVAAEPEPERPAARRPGLAAQAQARGAPASTGAAAAAAEAARERRDRELSGARRSASVAVAQRQRAQLLRAGKAAEAARQGNRKEPDLMALTQRLCPRETPPRLRFCIVADTIYRTAALMSFSQAFDPAATPAAVAVLSAQVAFESLGTQRIWFAVVLEALEREEAENGGPYYTGAARKPEALLQLLYVLLAGFDRGHVGVSPAVLKAAYRYSQCVMLQDAVLFGGAPTDGPARRCVQACEAVRALTPIGRQAAQAFARYRAQDFAAHFAAAQAAPVDAGVLRACRPLAAEALAADFERATNARGLRALVALGRPECAQRRLPRVRAPADYAAFPLALRHEYAVSAAWTTEEGAAPAPGGGMPAPRAAAQAESGNRAVGWMVCRAVYAMVARAAKKAEDRARAADGAAAGPAVTSSRDYLNVLAELLDYLQTETETETAAETETETAAQPSPA
jgi:hypothetical protein